MGLGRLMCPTKVNGIKTFISFMDSLHSSVSTSSEEIVVNDSSSASEEIAVSDDVSAKYAEEIVAYEHNDESEAIKMNLFYRVDGLYKVLRNLEDGSVVCSCQLFLRVGILCRHVFCVFKNANIEVIPSQYILTHWTKNLIPPALRNKRNRYGEKNEINANIEVIPSQYILRRWTKNLIPPALRNKRNRYCEKNEIVENYANEASSIVDHCVHILSKDEPRLASFVEKLRLLKIDVEADCPNPPSKNKADNLEELVGVPKPATKTVNNPSLGNPKGRKKLRIKGGKEQALDKNSKNRNACSLCGETDGHNRRTCPKKFAEEAELDQAEVTIEGDLDQSEVTREADLDQAEVTS
ncbi:FAR1 DNA binding domain, Zinc finger, SWIM-type, MULE transposase domain, FHY3/FAR1 family [Artemisia annua]|uniref:FAR1 DNA binding domain, Zinc finger, SWIM-type, MULE transposase domain, FHY3/FAR1 family n=1 Tax=Artemisia annua TaxID=35608 RepID=A0A2U1PSF0_ARTAN|nr:FAR1 DNA binding domain, Zinc finger, SWIM-type, MULE transposase domain, FHY3/FAR1 family [Artemisia annua]